MVIDKTIFLIEGKRIIVKSEDVFVGKVVKSGNGAVVSFRKKHIGKEVYVILK